MVDLTKVFVSVAATASRCLKSV